MQSIILDSNAHKGSSLYYPGLLVFLEIVIEGICITESNQDILQIICLILKILQFIL